MPSKLTLSEFILKASNVHGNVYDYSKSIYKNSKDKLIITCTAHGEFLQTPNEHLSGKGCKQCGIISRTNLKRFNTNTFIEKAHKVHNNIYTYNNTVYKDSYSKIIITCSIHGDFKQEANSHLRGHGCPLCAISNNNSRLLLDKPTTLYYFNIDNVWKIGITTQSLEKRYKQKDYEKISNVLTWKFPTGHEAYKYEQDIINLNQEHAYHGPTPFTDGTGITECFNKDIYPKDLK